VFGAGASFSQGGDSNVLFHTVDAQYENHKGIALYGAYVGVWSEIGDDEPDPMGDYYDYGFLAQAGYMLTEKLEAFVRAGYTQLDDGSIPAGSDPDVPEFTVGANYFFRKHHVRFTLYFTWLPNGSPINVTGSGIVQGNENQYVIRAQFQLFI
jgi:predicted porin